jgi:hypothetical protein
MPYAVVKQKCKQSDGDSGSWIVKRRDTGKKVSCHQSKEKAQGSVSARHVNETELDEEIDDLVEAVLRRILWESHLQNIRPLL